ncbi:MAG: hypothetical protein A3G81_16325 [Betaproteobacteria bacterium RIFCSPLOWO2_12_FULL_65_14]|nr:MAG: hypothetical protein A3G81_16325 [Betaproteobacteria bacterium RIFCSPLOWO2_12_FULL_65_14]
MKQGTAYRQHGDLHLAIDTLSSALRQAGDTQLKTRIAGELGVAYYQAHRYDEAEPLLKRAYQGASNPAERMRHAIDLGNLHAARKQAGDAARYYGEARAQTDADPSTVVSAGLNLARMAPENERLSKLAALIPELEAVSDGRERARYYLNLGQQARMLGAPALRLAYESLEQARQLTGNGRDALAAEALDAFAQLYEDQKRDAEALELTERAIGRLQGSEAHALLVNLEWRRGRLLRRLGHGSLALGAYQRAVDHIESIRQDIPVEYTDGRSSFRETLEPVYLGLADLLLLQANDTGPEQAQLIRRARDVVELIKQTELEDFLGDRCTIETVRAAKSAIPAGAAVFYPIILPDRLELLLETTAGLQRRTVSANADAVRRESLRLARAMRNVSLYTEASQQLHQWLIEPIEPLLAEQRIDTVVVIPDGVLRLLPFAALHDGKQFMAEKYAVAVVPGLTLTHVLDPGKRKRTTLLAGLSEPGPVVDKLPQEMAAAMLTSDRTTTGESGARAVRGASAFARRGGVRDPMSSAMVLSQDKQPPMSAESAGGAEPARVQRNSTRLKQLLALPGVKDEIEALGRVTRNQTLFNQNFTVAALQHELGAEDHGIVHIASHGFFGGTAETSFIMAFDDVVTMDGLQTLLRSEAKQKNPIELLTLSACETAEGDDRSPLGMSGAALKARANTVLGSLWPVSDQAAKIMMNTFYQGLSGEGITKVKALQKAQRQLIDSADMQHPFFWAPFVLIGNWL